MKFKYLLQEYFTYSASEKKGIFVLLILIILLFLLSFFYCENTREYSLQDQLKQKELDQFLAEIVLKKKNAKLHKNTNKLFSFDPNKVSQVQLLDLGFTRFQSKNIIKYRSRGGRFKNKNDLLRIYGITQKDISRYDSVLIFPKRKRTYKENKSIPVRTLFLFDPNATSEHDWMRLGVSSYLAKRIKNYLASGATFKLPSDLKKIYGFDTILLKELYPYVRIKNKEFVKELLPLFELNTIDSIGLKSLSGIGNILSRRIIKYRILCGGFVSKDQLLEVYGFTRDKFDRISGRFVVDSSLIQKIGINTSNLGDLRKHPYIDYRIAKDIIRYRLRNGSFLSVTELREHHLISDSSFVKLRPYLNLK